MLALPLAGCGDDGHASPPDAGSAIDAGATPDGVAASTGPRGLAVINSDYASTSITLLDPATGAVANDHCIDSGARPPGTTTALSGDVVLPSAPQRDHAIVAIDRSNGVLTWLDPADCAASHQLDVSTGFSANPHDVIAVSATKAYVTRYEKNARPSADPDDFDDGDDLLIIDPSIPKVTGRIALSPYAAPLAGKTIQARPDRARLIDGKLYVALNDISGDFQAMSNGRVAVVDPATDTVTGTIDVPELSNCGSLSYVAATHTLVVSCAGDYTQADPSLTSGLAYIDLAPSPPVETKHQLAAAFGGRALGAYSGIANDGALGFAVTAGVFGGDPKDQLWRFDVATGAATKITDATDSFVFGTVLIDADHEQVFLTDAAADLPRVRIYDYASAAVTAKTPVTPDPKHGLPPREIAWY